MAGKNTEYQLAIKIAGAVAASFNTTMGTVSKALSGLGSAAATAGKVAAVAAGAAATAMGAFAKSAVDVGMEFDQSMSQVAATMGKTVDEIGDLRQLAMDMGAKTAFSATQAAEALNYMALAGYDAETSTKMLPNVLNLAAAGGMELATASDMITDSQSALGLTIEQTSALVDQMAAASSKSNTSVAQLGEAILTVGGTAQYMAGGTEELATVLGVLADNGIKGSEGGTHLRNMLLSLSSPTTDAQKTLDALGVSVFDAEGNMRSFSAIFPELNAAMSAMTDQERLDAFSTIFNSRDIASATALLGTTTERWEELGDAILNSKDAAEMMANTQLDNLAGDITLWNSALEGAQIVLSDQLTPSLREFVQFGADGLGRVTDAFKEGGLSGAMSALGGILSDGLNLILEQAPGFAEAGMQLLGALGQGILDNLPAITEAAVTISLMLIRGLVSSLPMLAEGGAQMLVQLAEGIASALPELIPAIVSVIFEIVKALTNPEMLTSLLGAALSILLALAEGLIQAIPALIEALPAIIENLITALIAAAPMIAEAGVQLLGALVMNLPDILMAILQAIPAIIFGILNAFGQSELASGLSVIFQNAFSGIFSALEHVKAVFSGVIDFINNVFAGNWSNAWQNIQDIFRNLFSAIVDLAKMPINGVISAINFVFEKINGMSIDIPDWVPGVGGQTLGFHLPAIPQLAEGGIVTGPTVLEAGEAGDEAIVPLAELWEQMQGFVDDALAAPSNWIADALSALGSGGEGNPEPGSDLPPIYITYSPVYHFEGEAPTREDLAEAEKLSQEEFNKMAAQWLKEARRTNFRG